MNKKTKMFYCTRCCLPESSPNIKFMSILPKYVIESTAIITLFIIAFISIQSSDQSYRSDILPIIGVFALGAQKILPLIQLSYVSWSNLTGYNASIVSVIEEINNNNELSIRKKDYKNTKNKVKNKFGLSLENISFGYVSTQKIIDNLNIFFKKGEIVSISGRSGAGKSTLLDIIMGLIEPDKGLIAFEGSIVNKSKADLIAWQKNISYVPQEIFLIDDDISMNIALGQSKNNIDFKKIQKVIEITDLEDFVKNQKYGLKTRVGERGAKVSGGQKQRIAIARALYKDFNLLILDEATSALDIVSQNKIIGNIKKFYKDKIIIFVSHNDKLIESCDRNYDLKN